MSGNMLWEAALANFITWAKCWLKPGAGFNNMVGLCCGAYNLKWQWLRNTWDWIRGVLHPFCLFCPLPTIYWPLIKSQAFPGGSDSKESACNAGDWDSIPGSGRFPWRRKWQPTPILFPGKSQDGGTLKEVLRFNLDLKTVFKNQQIFLCITYDLGSLKKRLLCSKCMVKLASNNCFL